MLESIEELNLNQRRITADDILTNLTTGFSWHEPEKAHPHLNQPERWWAEISIR